MVNKVETRKLTFRKELFGVQFQYYLCEETGAEFTDEGMEMANINQVYNRYRDKYGIPLPEEIIGIRKKYGLAASEMSAILGFGANEYRNYEVGEIPSISKGRLNQLAKSPIELKKLLLLSKNTIGEFSIKKANSKIEQV